MNSLLSTPQLEFRTFVVVESGFHQPKMEQCLLLGLGSALIQVKQVRLKGVSSLTGRLNFDFEVFFQGNGW